MAGATDGRKLLDLAAEVADDGGVDWGEARRSYPDLDPVLSNLERLQHVASSFREARASVEAHGAGSPEEEILFRWGHLEVLEQLGAGTYGEVYRAWDPVLAREVALKLRGLGPGASRSSGRHYIQEARRLARVRHPNVLTVLGADLHDGRVGLWTELVRGRSLEQHLEEHGAMGPREALGVGIDLCRALAAVHGANLVHGDVKAANVLREEGGRIVLADFGAGSDLEGAKAAGRALRGTPLTTAPEVLLEGRTGPRADLYSLGALLYRLVSGRHPVEAKDLGELLDRHRSGESRPLRDLRPDLPAGFIAVVERATSPDPKRRFGSAGAMERALVAAVQETPTESSAAERATLGRSLLWAAAAALVVALLVVGLGPRMAGDAADGVQAARTSSSPQAGGEESVPAPGSPAADLPPDGSTTGSGSWHSESEPGASSTAVEPPVAAPAPLRADATLYRDRGGVRRPLAAADLVSPGDQLSLELEASERAFLYVLNEDETGEVFVLFPLEGLSPSNPLAPHRIHRLPAADRDWRVTSAGGTETFLVIASRQRLVDLEEDLGSFEAAAESRPVRPGGGSETLRGVGGLAPATVPQGRLAALTEGLLERQDDGAGGIWLRRFEVRNPRPE